MVMGGLIFVGGLYNNYVMYFIVMMVECLWKQLGTKGLVMVNGGYLLMYVFGVYFMQLLEYGFQYVDLQVEVNCRLG